MAKSLFKKMVSVSLISLMPFISYAGNVGSSMDDFMNDMGSLTNVTPGGHYQGQSAGHVTLGNTFVRNKIKNKNFASLQMPSYRAGCGGIDMFAGSFSYISADELIQTFNAIGSNALAFAFKLGLETLSPQISEQISELQNIMQEMNNFQINSCEQASALVGGLWPKQDEASKSICTNIGSRRGLFSDYTAAKHGCSNEGQRASTLNIDDPETDAIKVTNVNFAWKAIRDSGIVGVGSAFNREMAELIMTLSGTVIVTTGANDDSPNDYTNIIGKADSNDVLTALLDGGTIDVIRCDEEEKCLDPTVDGATHTIAATKGFHARVRETLIGIVDKVADESTEYYRLTPEEHALLNITSIPILKIINVSAAYSGATSFFEMQKYSEIIAMEYLFDYVGNIMKDVETAVNILKVGSESDLETFRDNITKVRMALDSRGIKESEKVRTLLTMIERTSLIESKLSSRFGNFISIKSNRLKKEDK